MSRARQPSARSPRSGRDPQLVEKVLPNGLRVVLCPKPHLAYAYVGLSFGVGSRHETADTNGISHVLEHMLFRGTRRYRDATALNAAAEDFGGFLEGATYRDHTTFGTGCHPSSIERAVSIIGELAQSPRYHSIGVEKAILREELLETLDSDGRMIDLDNLAHRAIFGSTGLGLPIEGTLENLESVGVEQLEEHRARYLVARNAVVSIAGPFNPRKVLQKVARTFEKMPSGAPPNLVSATVPAPEPRLRFVRDPASQVDLRISFRAACVAHSDYPAQMMLARVLADGLASRMHSDLVDRRGLAYSLGAGLTTYEDCGLFEFDLSVAPNRAAEVVGAILDFATAAGRFRYTEQELRRMRRRYRFGLEFMGDAAGDLASWHGRSALFGSQKAMSRMGACFSRLGETDIRRVARQIFVPKGMVLVATGELARGEWGRVRKTVDAWRK